jgi:hypothetical protein
MTSKIDYTAINQGFPVVGQDNDSQGFRDNFGAANANFKHAYDEITALQTNSVFVADPTKTVPTPYQNNLQQSILYNGSYLQFTGVYNSVTTPATGTVQVDLNYGPVQKFTVAGNTTLNFIHWPTAATTFGFAGVYSTIRVMLIGDQQNAISNSGNPYTISINNSSGNVKFATGYTPVTVAANGKYEIIEIFTVDSGSNIFVRNVGEF